MTTAIDEAALAAMLAACASRGAGRIAGSGAVVPYWARMVEPPPKPAVPAWQQEQPKPLLTADQRIAAALERVAAAQERLAKAAEQSAQPIKRLAHTEASESA